MKPSEMIDLYLDEVIASTAMPLDIDLETILGVVSLNFDDFGLGFIRIGLPLKSNDFLR